MLRVLLIVFLSFPALAQELEVKNQTAQDILKQIDGEVGEELEKRIEALKQEAVQPPPPAILEPANIKTSELSDYHLKFEFVGSELGLSGTQKTELQDVPVKFKRVPPSRIQVVSYNNSNGISANENRRISLVRALAVRDELEALNISYRDVDLIPLGNTQNKNEIEIRFTPL